MLDPSSFSARIEHKYMVDGRRPRTIAEEDAPAMEGTKSTAILTSVDVFQLIPFSFSSPASDKGEDDSTLEWSASGQNVVDKM